MATELQEKLAEAIVENRKKPIRQRKNKKELVASVGYGAGVAKHKPNVILEAKGVKQALAAYGLTEELITAALVDDIKNKPGKRLGELSLGADVLGMKEEGKKNDPPNHMTVINLIMPNGSNN